MRVNKQSQSFFFGPFLDNDSNRKDGMWTIRSEERYLLLLLQMEQV